MNWVDLILILIVLSAVWGGWHKGFISGVLDLVNWLGSLLLGFVFYPYLASFLTKIFPSLQVWRLPLAFIITVIIARILIGIVTGKIALATSADTGQSMVNRTFGIFPGFVNGIILAAIISALLLALPLMDGINKAARTSIIANRLSAKMEWINEKLSPVFDKAINQTINNLTIHPKSGESINLPFKMDDPVADSSLEVKMIKLLNDERTQRGLSPLKADRELTQVARAHSKDMFVKGYFSHISPDGKDPFDRMNAAGIRYLAAGENIALAQSLSIAHSGLMNSPGHRANILNPAFGHVGIGILDGGIYGLMISQEFGN